MKIPLDPWFFSRRRLAVAGVLLALFLSPGTLRAQDAWKSTLELYFMGAAMSGTAGVGPAEAEIDLTASEVLENLELGALANYRGENQRFAVTADVVFMGLGASSEGERGLLSAHVDADEWIAQVHGSWRTSSVFELLAGVRYTSLTTAVVLTPVTGSVLSGEASESWFDPIVGARFKAPVGKALSLEGYGDVGGFGVGSDLTWMATARLNLQVSPAVGLGLGYRVLYQDFETGEPGTAGRFKWDVTSQGPLMAANLSF